MAGRIALTVAALASVYAQAEHFTVPLTLHPGNELGTGVHINHGLARLRRSLKRSYVIEPETFSSNKFWYGAFDVGDSKNLSLAIDTGSSYLVVNPGLYKPSSSAINLNRTGAAAYIGTDPDGCGSLNISFSKYADTVSVQGISAKNQHLADTHKIPTPRPGEISVLPPPYQGIVGLSGQSLLPIAGTGGLPFFANLCNQSAVAECRFGVAFGTSGKGKQIFGGIDDSLFEGPLSRTPQYLAEWLIKGGFASDDQILGRNQTFILDTGTPNVIGPMPYVRKLFELHNIQIQEVEEPGCFSPKVIFGYYPCDAVPQIGFTVGDTIFHIDNSSFALKDNGNNNCTSTIVGVTPHSLGPNVWLIGQSWMQGKYLDFDAGGNSVAAAVLKDPTGAA